MTLWHWLQSALALGALIEIARAARMLLVRAPCDARGLSEAVEIARRAGQRSLAKALAHACHPAWIARAWSAGLDAGDSPAARQAVEELHFDLVARATDRLRSLAAMARLASALAFLAIVLELAWAFGGGHGLLALQRGLVERLAIENALLSFAVGLATNGACLAVVAPLRAQLEAFSKELRRVAMRIAPADERAADM